MKWRISSSSSAIGVGLVVGVARLGVFYLLLGESGVGFIGSMRCVFPVLLQLVLVGGVGVLVLWLSIVGWGFPGCKGGLCGSLGSVPRHCGSQGSCFRLFFSCSFGLLFGLSVFGQCECFLVPPLEFKTCTRVLTAK